MLRLKPGPVWIPGHCGEGGKFGIGEWREMEVDHQGEEVKSREKDSGEKAEH